MSNTNQPGIPAIEFRNVSKIYRLYKSDRRRFLGFVFGFLKYRAKPANDSLTFTVNHGESVAVLGRNGAGKSTLLKIITGVTFPTSGEVKVNGSVSALLELTAGFEMSFTGRENIHLKASLMGLNKKQIVLLEQQIINFAELDEYIDQPVRSYSNGMKARLGFAINVHIRPDILLIDEALSVGDAKFQEKCRKKVIEVRQARNATLVFVTHTIDAAKKFCERGIVLDRGKLVFDGPIDEACDLYETL
jgi:teichoic acid transport system ATP-binding protein